MQRLMRFFEDFAYGFDAGVDVPMEAAHALVRGLDVREYDETFGSVEPAERDFLVQAIAMVNECRTCTIAAHRRWPSR